MQNTTEKTKKSRKKKPLRKAERWGGRVLPMAGRMVTLLVVIVVMGLMSSALQAVGMGLRVALTVVIAAAMLLLFYSEGVTQGAMDAAASRNYVSLAAKGLKMDAKEDAACYHPLKALCAALAVFAVPLALSVAVALTTREYTYTLQDLPGWLTESYGARGDVLAPLGAYTAERSATAWDWLRIAVRLFVMCFINLFSDPITMGASIDRLSPLFVASYPLSYVIGYLRGPASNRRIEKSNRRAKKVAVRKAQRSSLVEELTGAQGQVHYGQKKETHKKRELI